MLRSFLLAPCLLICLACATPFPLDSLEKGMTYETVRENFGEPESIETEPPFGVATFWTYAHEETFWQAFLFPQFLLSIPICAAIPDVQWDCGYVSSRPLLLHFEEEKLARWEVIRPVYVDDFTTDYPDYGHMFSERDDSPVKDAIHHARGHKEHHVDHDDDNPVKDAVHHKEGHEHHHVDHDDPC